MGKCRICGTDYYTGHYNVEPDEPCVCGEMCNCNLLEWNGWDAVKKFLIYRTANVFYAIGSWVLDLDPKNR